MVVALPRARTPSGATGPGQRSGPGHGGAAQLSGWTVRAASSAPSRPNCADLGLSGVLGLLAAHERIASGAAPGSAPLAKPLHTRSALARSLGFERSAAWPWFAIAPAFGVSTSLATTRGQWSEVTPTTVRGAADSWWGWSAREQEPQWKEEGETEKEEAKEW